MALSGLIRPPLLQHSETDSGTQRTATWLELFFDLAFVLVVAELASGLRNDLTPHGARVFAGLFTSVWWAWAGFTFYANRFDTDDLVYRLAKLAAMLAVVGLAASVTEATTTRAAQFAICQAVLRLVLVALYLRLSSRRPGPRRHHRLPRRRRARGAAVAGRRGRASSAPLPLLGARDRRRGGRPDPGHRTLGRPAAASRAPARTLRSSHHPGARRISRRRRRRRARHPLGPDHRHRRRPGLCGRGRPVVDLLRPDRSGHHRHPGPARRAPHHPSCTTSTPTGTGPSPWG
jgi:Bacterial low temperature requirement A protein (LtrA)